MDDILHMYNKMLREEYGEGVTVEIKSYEEDDGTTWFYYTSARYGDSYAFETAKEAYDDACIYLSYVGEIW